MRIYITKKGVLRTFEDNPIVNSVFNANRKFLHKEIINHLDNLISELATCDKVLFLEPEEQLIKATVIDTVFESFVPNTSPQLLALIQNTENYIVVSKIVHESYTTLLDAYILDTVDYDRLSRIHIIDNFLLNN